MKRVIAACAALLLAGCGIKHQAIHPNLPSAHINPTGGKAIVVSEVTDSRQPMDGLKLGNDERLRSVGGEVRGGNGFAVDLADGTVAGLGRQLVVQSLRSMGYRVVDDVAGADAPHVAVSITQFSVAMPFNFIRVMGYSQQMVADIATTVTVHNRTAVQSFEVNGHGTNVYQVIKPENWEVALNEAMEDYSKRFQAKMLSVE